MSDKKVSILRAKIIANVENMTDEPLLTAMLIFSSQARKDPKGTKAKSTTKPKSKIPAGPTPEATEVRILEYEFGGKKMIAVQANGKPDEALLTVCKGNKMRFYRNVPSNPFNNDVPFWAGKASDELKSALQAAA